MQINVNSTNISKFGFKAKFDLYNKRIVFDTSGLTVYNGSGINNVKGIAFSVVDSQGVILASINWTAPQIPTPSTGQSWVLDLSALNFAFLFQTYNIVGAIQDQDGTVYATPNIYKNVCEPVGFNDSGYVPGIFQIQADCSNNNLSVKELTALVYNSEVPSSVTKSGTLYYPTGTISAVAFANTPFSNNQIYTGQYRIKCSTIGEYSLGDDVYVDVNYYTDSVFDVTCNNRMSDILCCIMAVQNIAIKECNNSKGQAAKQQLADIAIPFMTGLTKEINGMDASAEADFIKNQLACNCGATSLGQNEITPISPSIYNIVVIGAGGTTVTPSTVGNTKNFTVSSNIYQVVKGDLSDTAFSIQIDTTSTPGTVKYIITFDYEQIAQNVLNQIQGNATLLTQLNNMVNASGVDLSTLNGGCVIDTNHVDYALTQDVNGSTLVASVVIDGVIYAAPSNLFGTDQAGILSWLNSLSKGTFSVNVAGGLLNILSLANTHVVSTMTFTTPNLTVAFSAHSVTVESVLQAIITYLCAITDLQVTLNATLNICTFDIGGNIVTTPISGSQSNLNAAVAAAICNIAARIQAISLNTCNTISALFTPNPALVFDVTNDSLLSIVGGACTKLSGKQLAQAVLNAINTYSDLKSLFCAIDCTIPGTCPDVAGVSFNALSNIAVGFYGLTWATPTSSSHTVTIKYRVHGTSTWVTATSSMVILPNGTISGTVPYVISGLTPNTNYDFWVQDNCGGNGFFTQVQTPANTLYTDSYLIGNNVYSVCGNAPVTLYSSVPYAVGVTLYLDSGLTTPVTGSLFVVRVADLHVHNLNTSTGVVGSDTGVICSIGTAISVLLGNSTGTICAGAPTTVYSSAPFTVGGTLYSDSGLTTPVTGFSYVAYLSNNHIYNLNSVNGIIGSDTGLSCSGNTVQISNSMPNMSMTAVSIPGFTPSPALPLNTGGTVVGTHSGFTGAITFTISGSLLFNPSNVQLYVNGSFVQCIPIVGAGSFGFASRTYAAGDVINIYMNTGSC